MIETSPVRKILAPPTWENRLWVTMRLSAVLLIPLAWIHVLLQDVIVGVDNINVDYVAARWALLGWRVFDAALLWLALGHGLNGLRNVIEDYLTGRRARRILRIGLAALWAAINTAGTIALIGGVR